MLLSKSASISSTNLASRSTTAIFTGEPSHLSHIRVPAFEGLRGIAVIAVILCHLSDYYPVSNTLKVILRAGWCGVDLFFVLSGFLITGILLDTRSAANYFRVFYARRVLRIFPVYYAALIATLTTARLIPELNSVLPVVHDRAFYLFYLNNWWMLLHDHWHANVIGHFWSLAIEEQFYFVWPFVVWRLARRYMEIAALCGMLLAPVIRIAIYAHFGGVRDIVENPFCRMDSLLTGALLASLVRRRISAGKWPLSVSFCTATAIIAGGFSSVVPLKIVHSMLFISSGLAITFGGLVFYAFEARNSTNITQRILRNPALTFCGRYSYGMYVYHVPLLWFIAREVTGLKAAANLPQFLLLGGSVLTLTILVSKVSFDYFEMYFLGWKTKFIPRPTC